MIHVKNKLVFEFTGQTDHQQKVSDSDKKLPCKTIMPEISYEVIRKKLHLVERQSEF